MPYQGKPPPPASIPSFSLLKTLSTASPMRTSPVARQVQNLVATAWIIGLNELCESRWLLLDPERRRRRWPRDYRVTTSQKTSHGIFASRAKPLESQKIRAEKVDSSSRPATFPKGGPGQCRRTSGCVVNRPRCLRTISSGGTGSSPRQPSTDREPGFAERANNQRARGKWIDSAACGASITRESISTTQSGHNHCQHH